MGHAQTVLNRSSALMVSGHAVHLSTTNVQGSTASAGWNANIWKTNSAGDVNLGGTSLVGPGRRWHGTSIPACRMGWADWETPNWSDGNPATVSAAMKPGSTYTLMPSGGNNTRMGTPEQPRTAVFPGSVLVVNGSAEFTNNFGGWRDLRNPVQTAKPKPSHSSRK